MIYIVDLLRRGDEHSNINIPIIKILSTHGLVDHMWISRDSTSLQYYAKPQSASVTKIDIQSDKFFKWITSTLLTIKILLHSNKTGVGILFLSSTPLHNFIITLFSFLQSQNVRHYIILHGELSYLVDPDGFGRRLGNFLLTFAFKILPLSKTVHVTLAHPIFCALKTRYRLDNHCLANLEMPVESDVGAPFFRKREQKLRIGSFGVHSEDKCSHFIYKLATLLESYSENFEIVTIGVSAGDFIYDQHPKVKHHCRGELQHSLIERSVFVEEIKNLDIALFFYGNNPRYEMVSSGAFIDCISYELPFAALSSNYFEYYIKEYGEIGFVTESLACLADEIYKISENREKLQSYKENLKSAKEAVSYQKFEERILQLLKRDILNG